MALTATPETEPTLRIETADPAELVERAAGGDDDAFRLLVRHLLPRLRRWAFARTGDPDDVDEVVQRTLIRMHDNLDRFQGESKLSTWLYRILRNAAVDLERARGARPTVSDRELTDASEPAGGPDPVRKLHAGRMATAVRELFDGLPDRQREVLLLVDHEGMRPVDVAAALDLNPVTVRAHLFKARRKVRERILERYPELKEGYEA